MNINLNTITSDVINDWNFTNNEAPSDPSYQGKLSLTYVDDFMLYTAYNNIVAKGIKPSTFVDMANGIDENGFAISCKGDKDTSFNYKYSKLTPTLLFVTCDGCQYHSYSCSNPWSYKLIWNNKSQFYYQGSAKSNSDWTAARRGYLPKRFLKTDFSTSDVMTFHSFLSSDEYPIKLGTQISLKVNYQTLNLSASKSKIYTKTINFSY